MYPETLRLKLFSESMDNLKLKLHNASSVQEIHGIQMLRLCLWEEFDAYIHRRDAIRAEAEARRQAKEEARRKVCDGWKRRKHFSKAYNRL